MTTIDKDIQRQDPGSALVELYEVTLPGGSVARFFAGLDDDLTPIQFRDSGGTAQTYTAIPMSAEGFDINTDGAHSRPELSIGNVGNILTNAIGGIEPEELTGERLTKRTTLEKYLVGNVGDTNPPTEFPKVVYILDRVKERNILQVTFELAAPFDLAGISLPKRQVIGGSCPFKYKGARKVTPIQNRVGGCNWDEKSSPVHNTGSSVDTTSVFMNRFDEYIVSDTITFTTFSSSATAGNYYKTQNAGLSYISSNGSIVALGSGGLNYWQCVKNTSQTPSDTNVNWRRVRVFNAYSSSTTYFAFTDPKFNAYVLRAGRLWQVTKKSQSAGAHGAFVVGNNWTEGDICGKKIASCRLRFHAQQHASISGGIAITTVADTPLPFGGFPSAKQRR